MKKLLWLGISVVILWAKQNCYDTAQKLHNLQNAIVEKSFITLPKGAWASYYPNIKVVNLGQRKENNLTLYGIEAYANQKPAQIWYKMIEKKFVVAGNTISFKTLDPYEIYLLMRNRVIRINKAEINLFMQMQGKKWSTILTFGQILVPPQCKNIPKLKTINYTFDDNKSTKAVKITDLKTQGYIIVSDNVPFGLIESGDKKDITLRMVSYGFKGAKSRIKNSMRKQAVSLPLFRK
jgi:hypothetical protein